MKQLPDDMLRQFWQDSKKEAPGGFSDFIMQNLPQETPLPQELKKPLISPKVGAMLAGLLVSLGFLISNLKGTAASAAPWYQSMQQAIDSSFDLFGNSSATLTYLAVLSMALVLLIGFDRLLQRLLQRPQH